MDLHSENAFWALKNGLIASYPSLQHHVHADVAIIGAGITGALVGYYLQQAGLKVVLLDKREVAHGSTAASTALLQYEVDTPLHELIELVGKDDAERSYALCLQSIHKLQQLIEQLKIDCGFMPKKSLYLASTEDDVDGVEREFAARQAMGIKLDYLIRSDITSRFTFDYPAALLSYDAAQVDAYRLAYGLLEHICNGGGLIFDHTEVVEIASEGSKVHLRTDRNCRVTADHLVMATGYESQQYLKEKVVHLLSTYALVTEPVDEITGWGEDQCLIWETARPYLYLRSTDDRRILIGGEDDPFRNPKVRDSRIGKKSKNLKKRLDELFPNISTVVDYAWGGTFGTTQDGLAYIGPSPEYPQTYFALGFGGNGITYSQVAAEILCDLITGMPNDDAHIFRFGRKLK
jgi:glycine/D-amino acid oxidase-like deaminating enzyme